MNCLNCQVPTKNIYFCSRSCAAKINNHKYPKRKKIESLCACGSNKTTTARYCRTCAHEEKFLNYGKKTLKESLVESLSYAAKHKYEKIRQHAKRISKKLNWNCGKCEKCGYDKHVEVCHKKAISDFSLNTLIQDINAKNNLIFLCPNCHWEYDNLL